MKEAPITVGIGEPSTVRPWTASVEISSKSFHLLPCLDHAQAVLEDEIRGEQLHCLPGRWARFPGLVCFALRWKWFGSLSPTDGRIVERRLKLAAQLIHKNNPLLCAERALNLCVGSSIASASCRGFALRWFPAQGEENGFQNPQNGRSRGCAVADYSFEH